MTPSNYTILSFDEAFLQSVGVDPAAWTAVIEHLSALAAQPPGAFGVTCTTLNKDTAINPGMRALSAGCEM